MKNSNIVLGSMPIGDDKDISLNLIDKIKTSDIIAVETLDTFNQFLNRMNLQTDAEILPFEYHKTDLLNIDKHVENIFNYILEQSKNNKKILIISDEGSPQIIDPYGGITNFLFLNNLNYYVLPGPSSIINAICNSPFDPQTFSFLGMFHTFPDFSKPRIIEYMKHNIFPSIIFEIKPYILDLLNIFEEHLNERKIVICCDMTTDNEKRIITNAKQIKDIFLNNTYDIKKSRHFVFVIDRNVE